MTQPDWKAFDLEKLIEMADRRAHPYFEFLRVPQLSCGIYRLPAGAKDTQAEHDEDEVYLVLKGKARLRVGDETRDVAPGSILYVPADSQHGFVDVEEELDLLVFFGSGGPSGAEV